MATAKKLQKPKIIEIIGSTIRIAHPDIGGNIRTSLASPIAAAGTAMSVLDNNGLAASDWMLVGAIGDNQTETTSINGAVTPGLAITVNATLTFDHELDGPVTKINERGIAIYGSDTLGVAGTLIASIDAKTAAGKQLADAQMIQWEKAYTEYTLISTDTPYNYYYAKFTDGITLSDASDYVLASGLAYNAVENFIKQALNLTGAEISSLITREMCVQWADDCQSAITQYIYQDPTSGEYMQMDWDFEVSSDNTSIALSTNENSYSIASLSLKYPNSDKGVIAVGIGDKYPLNRMSLDDYVDLQTGQKRAEVATQAEIGDITLVVDSNVIFADSGTLYLGGDTVTYTGKTGTTTFTGIPASGTGSITAQNLVGSPVWQGPQPTLPQRYVIDQGTIKFEKPVSSTYASYPLNIRFYKRLTRLTEASDTTDISFTNVFQYYIGSMIERRRGNTEKAIELMKEFSRLVLSNALMNKAPTTDEYTYYSYEEFLPTVSSSTPFIDTY